MGAKLEGEHMTAPDFCDVDCRDGQAYAAGYHSPACDYRWDEWVHRNTTYFGMEVYEHGA